MDNVVVSRRKHPTKKGNKENTQPAHEGKLIIDREFCKTTSAAPLQLKRNEKEGTLVKSGFLKATAKRADTRSAPGEVLKKLNSVQRDGKGTAAAAAAGDAKQRQSLSQAFLTEQAEKQRKIAAEAPKPQAAAPSSKSAPGMYKGKVVQSKIGSIWKSSATVGGADPKPPAPKPEKPRVGNFTQQRSKSVADLHRRGTHKPAPTRCKSVTDGPVSKPPVATRPPTFRSARPPARTVQAALTSTSSKSTTVAPIKGSRSQNSVTDKKVNKPPPVTSTISQYRFTTESAEERRAKLADWLAAKGKTSKRPAMTTAAASCKTNVSAKPKADLKPQSQSQVEPQPAAQCDPEPVPEPEPEPSMDAQKSNSPEAPCADTQRAEVMTPSPTPGIMATTLDLLDISDTDLPVDSIVVNLCDALEALETPSKCTDDLSQETDECGNKEVDCKQEDECEKAELKNEIPKDVFEQTNDEAEESDEQKVETKKEVESDEEVMETTPEMEDASVVKYNIKTTPYLQSVRKTIEDKAQTTGCRRKSKIKDLKFLTPVRRSSRIQRQSCRLPLMLADHDPCVSSLAELLKLDEDPNAYIYRKNPALLDDLPDQTKL